MSWGYLRTYLARIELLDLASRHLDAGSPEVTAELLAGTAHGGGSLDCLGRLYLGVAHLRSADVERALAVLADPPSQAGLFWVTVRARHARGYCHAVANNLHDAEHLLLSLPASQRTHLPLHYLLLCKRGEFARAASRSRLAWLRQGALRPQPTGNYLGKHGERVVALLSALALTRAQTAPDVDHLAELLATAQPTTAGEYHYLEKDWPELRRFVEERVGEPCPDVTAPLPLPRARVVPRWATEKRRAATRPSRCAS